MTRRRLFQNGFKPRRQVVLSAMVPVSERHKPPIDLSRFRFRVALLATWRVYEQVLYHANLYLRPAFRSRRDFRAYNALPVRPTIFPRFHKTFGKRVVVGVVASPIRGRLRYARRNLGSWGRSLTHGRRGLRGNRIGQGVGLFGRGRLRGLRHRHPRQVGNPLFGRHAGEHRGLFRVVAELLE